MATGRVPTTANSPLTAKGDLFGYSTTQARVAVGNNGETLVADSSTSTGLRYQATQAAGKNYLINGGYDIWQRGTSFAAPSNLTYTTDRWWVWSGSSLAQKTITRQTGFSNNQYCARVARNSGQSETGAIGFGTIIESANMYALQGKTVTVSFFARAGANYSASGGNLQVLVQSGTGVDQGVGGWWSGWTGSSTLSSGNVVLTTTATKYSVTFTVPSNAAEMLVAFQWTPTGTAGAADYFEATGVQLEIGSVGTEFTRTGGTIQGELAACQRYCWKATSDAGDKVLAVGMYFNTTVISGMLQFPVTMRTSPTATVVNSTNYWQMAVNNGTDYFNGLAVIQISQNTALLESTSGASGTAGQAGVIKSADVAASLILSAEL